MTTPTDAEYKKASNWVTRLSRPLILSHTKPDGDALGSLVALRSLLMLQGASPAAVIFEPLPESYAHFRKFDPLPVLGVDVSERDLKAADGVIVVDTCTKAQLEPIAAWLKRCGKPILAVDHHVNRDDIADQYLLDESAAAACLILYHWARAAGWAMDVPAREAMFIGLATDTGWFRFSNTDARVFEAVAELAAAGVAAHDLHQALYQRQRPATVRLLGAAIRSLELMADDRLALMSLTAADFESCGAESGDTENIVNEPLRIESVAVSVIMVDQGEGIVRCSFRSKPPGSPNDVDVDVSRIAQILGGGGHRRAAATRITGGLAGVRNRVVEEVLSALK